METNAGQTFILVPASTTYDQSSTPHSSAQTFILLPGAMTLVQTPQPPPTTSSVPAAWLQPSTSNARQINPIQNIEVIDISDDEMDVTDLSNENKEPSSSTSHFKVSQNIVSSRKSHSDMPVPAVPQLHDNYDEDAIVNWILVEDNGESRNDTFHRIEKKAVFKVEHK